MSLEFLGVIQKLNSIDIPNIRKNILISYKIDLKIEVFWSSFSGSQSCILMVRKFEKNLVEALSIGESDPNLNKRLIDHWHSVFVLHDELDPQPICRFENGLLILRANWSVSGIDPSLLLSVLSTLPG